jgi:hypothetical protein
MKIIKLAFVGMLLMAIIFLMSCADFNEPTEIEHTLEIEAVFPTSGYARDIYVSDSLLYIAEEQMGFSIYRIETDSLFLHYQEQPQKVLLLYPVEERNLLFIYDEVHSDRIWVYDISDPDSLKVKPSVLGGTSGVKDMHCLQSIGDSIDVMWTKDNKFYHGVYTDYWLGLLVEPEFPLQFPTPLAGFEFDNDFFYLAGYQGGFYIADRRSGNILSATDTPGQALAVAVNNDYAYIADRECGLQVIDISDKSNPSLLEEASYDINYGYAQEIDISGNYLAIAWGGSGVFLFDISNPAKPVYMDSIDDEEIGYTYDVEFYKDKLYVATRTQVLKFKINNKKGNIYE